MREGEAMTALREETRTHGRHRADTDTAGPSVDSIIDRLQRERDEEILARLDETDAPLWWETDSGGIELTPYRPGGLVTPDPEDTIGFLPLDVTKVDWNPPADFHYDNPPRGQEDTESFRKFMEADPDPSTTRPRFWRRTARHIREGITRFWEVLCT